MVTRGDAIFARSPVDSAFWPAIVFKDDNGRWQRPDGSLFVSFIYGPSKVKQWVTRSQLLNWNETRAQRYASRNEHPYNGTKYLKAINSARSRMSKRYPDGPAAAAARIPAPAPEPAAAQDPVPVLPAQPHPDAGDLLLGPTEANEVPAPYVADPQHVSPQGNIAGLDFPPLEQPGILFDQHPSPAGRSPIVTPMKANQSNLMPADTAVGLLGGTGASPKTNQRPQQPADGEFSRSTSFMDVLNAADALDSSERRRPLADAAGAPRGIGLPVATDDAIVSPGRTSPRAARSSRSLSENDTLNSRKRRSSANGTSPSRREPRKYASNRIKKQKRRYLSDEDNDYTPPEPSGGRVMKSAGEKRKAKDSRIPLDNNESGEEPSSLVSSFAPLTMVESGMVAMVRHGHYPPWPVIVNSFLHPDEKAVIIPDKAETVWVYFLNSYVAETVDLKELLVFDEENIYKTLEEIQRIEMRGDKTEKGVKLKFIGDMRGAIQEGRDRQLRKELFHPPSRAAGDPKCDLQLGDIVMARVDCYPPWPGKIAKSKNKKDDGQLAGTYCTFQENRIKMHVKFYDGTAGWAPAVDIWPYTEENAKRVPVREDNKLYIDYQKSMEKANKDLRKASKQTKEE